MTLLLVHNFFLNVYFTLVSHTAHAPLTTGCQGNLTIKLFAAKKCNKHRLMKHYKTTMHAHQKWRETGEHSWCYSNSKFQTTRCYFGFYLFCLFSDLFTDISQSHFPFFRSQLGMYSSLGKLKKLKKIKESVLEIVKKKKKSSAAVFFHFPILLLC